MSENEIIKLARETIEALRPVYNGNTFLFDTLVAQQVTGPANLRLRQYIIVVVTGKKIPLTQCTELKVSEALKATFDQKSLF